MTWARGRAAIERLLRDGGLERVTPSADVAERLMRDAEAHIKLGSSGSGDDPAGALQLAYDAARKASLALLVVQGLRGTSRGGHVAVLNAVRAQFDEIGGIGTFGRVDRLRRRRNASEYPSEGSPRVTLPETERALAIARDTVDTVARLLASGRLDPFD